MVIRPLLLAFLTAPSFLACRALPPAEGSEVIAYEETEHGIVDLFDVPGELTASGGRDILRAGPRSTEFSGPLRPCANPDFYCFVTGLHVAVPKVGTPSSWRADGNECQVVGGGPLASDRTVRVFCRVSAQNAVEFSFSRQRGITSYRRICPDCYQGEFVLIGPRGIFASPPIP